MTTNIEAARALYARTLAEKFALGALNMDNQETLIGIALGRAEKGARARGGLQRRGADDRSAECAWFGGQLPTRVWHRDVPEFGPLAERGGSQGRHRRGVRVYSYRLQPGEARCHR